MADKKANNAKAKERFVATGAGIKLTHKEKKPVKK